MSFLAQPCHRFGKNIYDVPSGPLDPSVADDIPLDQRLSSAIGIDDTYPYGSVIGAIPPSMRKADDKTLYFKVADIPDWQSYDFPELAKMSLPKGS